MLVVGLRRTGVAGHIWHDAACGGWDNPLAALDNTLLHCHWSVNAVKFVVETC